MLRKVRQRTICAFKELFFTQAVSSASFSTAEVHNSHHTRKAEKKPQKIPACRRAERAYAKTSLTYTAGSSFPSLRPGQRINGIATRLPNKIRTPFTAPGTLLERGLRTGLLRSAYFRAWTRRIEEPILRDQSTAAQRPKKQSLRLPRFKPSLLPRCNVFSPSGTHERESNRHRRARRTIQAEVH